jgi:uncharacterized DUF497 family protein
LLHITLTLRGHQTLIRIISARDMHRKERAVHQNHNPAVARNAA